MFKLEENYYFLLLVLLPVFYLVFLYYRKKTGESWKILGYYPNLKRSLLLDKDTLKLKLILFNLVLFFSIIALVNPQFGKKNEKVKTQNVDVFLVLDVSQSMLCTDIKPNRLARAQIWIKQFLDRFRSERIGFISFAGTAYLHAPLTTDIPTILLMSNMAGPNNISSQGTSIADAIELAIKSFGSNQGFHKVIVLLSDGEDHEGAAIEAAKKAQENGISIITVPVGTETGGAIPINAGNGENFKMNADGQLVITKPNRQLLNEIAEAGQGELLEMQDGDGSFELLKKRFALLSKKEVTFQSFSNYQSYFQYPLALALLILIIETLISRRKK